MHPATDAPLELSTGDPVEAAVIWLHGLGADGNDFVPLISQLTLPPTAIRFVFPHAPMRPITLNGGYVMRGWYDIYDRSMDAREDAAGIRDSARVVGGLIETQVQRGIPAERIVLAGFSQGGAVALHTALRYPRRLAGVMCLSAYLPLADTLAMERNAANAYVPLFMAHGRQDAVVPYVLGNSARTLLEQMGYAVDWHHYDMEHTLCGEEINDIGEWLQEVLG